MKGATDEEIWEYAEANNFAIVSKDSDFYQRSLFYGSPPKFVWLCIGNCTREDLVRLLISHEQEIFAIETDPLKSILVLS